MLNSIKKHELLLQDTHYHAIIITTYTLPVFSITMNITNIQHLYLNDNFPSELPPSKSLTCSL